MKFPQRGNHKYGGTVAAYIAVVQQSNWEQCRVNRYAITKNYCVLHTQSNTTIFHPAVQ